MNGGSKFRFHEKLYLHNYLKIKSKIIIILIGQLFILGGYIYKSLLS